MNRTKNRNRKLAHARNLKRRSDKMFLNRVLIEKPSSHDVVVSLLRMPGTQIAHDRSGVAIPGEMPEHVRKSRLPYTDRPSRAGSNHALDPRVEYSQTQVWAQAAVNGKFHAATQVRGSDGTRYYPMSSCNISKGMNFEGLDVVGTEDVTSGSFCRKCQQG